jgi:hypothetical protein
MKYFRFHIVIAMALVTVTPCHGETPSIRDGSTIEKAIPLKQRGAKAIEEEMAWMMKRFHYTPLLASRDTLIEAIRKAKETKKAVHPPAPWEHATLEHGRQWCSYWMVRTPRGKRHIYFDTGISIETPGAVPAIESSRAQYMGHLLESLKTH